jgi:hypothetical protein
VTGAWNEDTDFILASRRKVPAWRTQIGPSCAQYIPSLCPISKSTSRWHLKISIKVVYFVTTNLDLHWIELQSLPVSLQVSTCSSLSLSTPEAVPATLACSVYTVQPPDCCHIHSLLHLHSKVVCILSSFIPHTSASRSPESYQRYHMSPPTTPDAHYAIPYSPTLTSLPTICSDKSLLPLFTATCPAPLEAEFNGALHTSKDLLPIASVFPPSTTISPSTILSLPPSILRYCHSSPTAYSSSPEAELTRTFWRSIL